jgi:hypothetical protein
MVPVSALGAAHGLPNMALVSAAKALLIALGGTRMDALLHNVFDA